MSDDRPFLGILLMFGFCTLAPLSDAIAKHLGPTVPLLTLLLVRFGAQAVLLMPVALARRMVLAPDAGTAWLMVLRTGLHIAGLAMIFTAFRYLPLADAIAIVFVMPFLLLLLGWLFLGERVGPYRLGAVAAGFCGTLMVIQPSFADVGWPALWPVGVAVSFALFMLVTRKIAKAVDPIAMQALSGVIAVPVLAAMLLLPEGPGTPPPLALDLPSGGALWLLFATGILGTLSHLLMVWSLRFAPTATLAPMQYLEIPLATLVGFAAFGDLPDGLAALGIVVTITAGLFIIARERSLARIAPPAA